MYTRIIIETQQLENHDEHILFFHKNAKTCAEMHCKAHLAKMINESCQLCCTALSLNEYEGGVQDTEGKLRPGYEGDLPEGVQLLAVVNERHPCCISVMRSPFLFQWVAHLALELCKIYKRTGNKSHKYEPLAKYLTERGLRKSYFDLADDYQIRIKSPRAKDLKEENYKDYIMYRKSEFIRCLEIEYLAENNELKQGTVEVAVVTSFPSSIDLVKCKIRDENCKTNFENALGLQKYDNGLFDSENDYRIICKDENNQVDVVQSYRATFVIAKNQLGTFRESSVPDWFQELKTIEIIKVKATKDFSFSAKKARERAYTLDLPWDDKRNWANDETPSFNQCKVYFYTNAKSDRYNEKFSYCSTKLVGEIESVDFQLVANVVPRKSVNHSLEINGTPMDLDESSTSEVANVPNKNLNKDMIELIEQYMKWRNPSKDVQNCLMLLPNLDVPSNLNIDVWFQEFFGNHIMEARKRKKKSLQCPCFYLFTCQKETKEVPLCVLATEKVVEAPNKVLILKLVSPAKGNALAGLINEQKKPWNFHSLTGDSDGIVLSLNKQSSQDYRDALEKNNTDKFHLAAWKLSSNIEMDKTNILTVPKMFSNPKSVIINLSSSEFWRTYLADVLLDCFFDMDGKTTPADVFYTDDETSNVKEEAIEFLCNVDTQSKIPMKDALLNFFGEVYTNDDWEKEILEVQDDVQLQIKELINANTKITASAVQYILVLIREIQNAKKKYPNKTAKIIKFNFASTSGEDDCQKGFLSSFKINNELDNPDYILCITQTLGIVCHKVVLGEWTQIKKTKKLSFVKCSGSAPLQQKYAKDEDALEHIINATDSETDSENSSSDEQDNQNDEDENNFSDSD